MTDIVQLPTTDPREINKLSALVVNLDTTKKSIVHYLFRPLFRFALGGMMIYAASLAITFVPLLIGASYGKNSLIERSDTLKLPFLWDVNVIFVFLVSLPCLLILVVSDQRALTRALSSVQSNGTVIVSNEDQNLIVGRWNAFFQIANATGQALGVVVGGLAAYSNYALFDPQAGQFIWSIYDHHLTPAAYIYGFCIFIFYAVLTVYVVRSITIAFLLKDIVSRARIQTVPLHPDGAGGLQAIGNLSLRNQYALTLIGLNAVLASVTEFFLRDSIGPHPYFIAIPVICYLIISPTVFAAPLLPFRHAMLSNKDYLIRRVAARIRKEFERLDQQIASGVVSKEDEELVERLSRIGFVFGAMPIWPLDTNILRKFFAAYIVPIVGAASYIAELWLKLGNFTKLPRGPI